MRAGRRRGGSRNGFLRARAARGAAVVVVASMPLAMWGPSASAAPLDWPSLSGVGAWLTGSAPVTVPHQRGGSAARLGHYVSAAATRAGHGAGGPPGVGRGQLPAYHARLPAVKKSTAGPGPAAGFDASTSTIVASARTATTDLYKNADGSYTRFVYSKPVNYQTPSGDFRPVQTQLAVAAGGRWQEKANAVGVSFGPRADDSVLGSLGLPSGRRVSFGMAGAAAVTGGVSGPSVTYAAALPGTDVVETATSTGIKETLKLRSASAAAAWVFPLHLRGLAAR